MTKRKPSKLFARHGRLALHDGCVSAVVRLEHDATLQLFCATTLCEPNERVLWFPARNIRVFEEMSDVDVDEAVRVAVKRMQDASLNSDTRR